MFNAKLELNKTKNRLEILLDEREQNGTPLNRSDLEKYEEKTILIQRVITNIEFAIDEIDEFLED